MDNAQLAHTVKQALRRSRKSHVVILQALLRDFQKDRKIVFFLCEGKDADYYRPRASTVFAGFSGIISFRNCNGKENLKQLLRSIVGNTSLNAARWLVFFDRDYEVDLLDIIHHRAYVTDGYSVENFYTSPAAVKEIVSGILFSDELHSAVDDDAAAELVAKFQKIQASIHKELLLFNCWAWAQRHLRDSGRINLDLFVVGAHIEIDFESGSVLSKYDLTVLNVLCPERVPVTFTDIKSGEAWFATRPFQKHFRGKQEVSVLFLFVNWLINQARQALHPFSYKINCSKRVSNREILADLSNYAETPMSLVAFLSYHKGLWEAEHLLC